MINTSERLKARNFFICRYFRFLWAIIFLPSNLNICFGCSKEPSHWDGSFEYPQHMVWLRNNKNTFQLCTFIWRPDLLIISRPVLHRERRKFLRTALKELALIYTDQPGLLGPKALLVLQALSMAQYEVHWLLRHFHNPPSKNNKVKMSQEDFIDR